MATIPQTTIAEKARRGEGGYGDKLAKVLGVDRKAFEASAKAASKIGPWRTTLARDCAAAVHCEGAGRGVMRSRL